MLGANAQLVAKGSIEAEAEILVQTAVFQATGKALSRLDFFSRLEDRFPEAAADKLLLMAGMRAEGKPLQHVTGVQVFLEHEYEVGPDVLIPRPETEFLVVQTIERLAARGLEPQLGLEIGIGSGAISIELLCAFPSLEMIATELTVEARQRAQSNAHRILGLAGCRLKILRSESPLEVCEPFRKGGPELRADFLISNPPYLGKSDPIEEEVLQHEPGAALFAPSEDLVYFYRAIAQGGKELLLEGACAFMEIPPERADQIVEIFKAERWSSVTILPDLTGRSRVLIATWAEKG